jgi:hypothetical protein
MDTHTEYTTTQAARRRLDLAEARTNARACNDTYVKAKLDVKRRLLAGAGDWKALGTNDKERELLIDLTIDEDTVVQTALGQLRYWQSQVDTLEAQVENDNNERRSLDRQSRDRRTAVLERLAAQGQPLSGIIDEEER